MRHFTFIVFMLVVVVSVVGYRCKPCGSYTCSDPGYCPYGEVKDFCDCCDKCGKGPGEKCGALWDRYGKCGVCMRCVGDSKTGTMPGKCINVKEIDG